MTQIYLPYNDFTLVARCLDNARLNKQITEAKQVYTANKYGFGFQGNPNPYKMWRGYEDLLARYIIELYKEWQIRLFRGQRGGKIYHSAGEYIINDIDLENKEIAEPSWINDGRVFSSYRAALLYKNYNHYGQFGWEEDPAVPIKVDKKGNATLPYFYGENKNE
jgi:hypothetical protein